MGGTDLKVRRLRAADSDLPLPCYMSEDAAGMDLAAGVETPVTLEPGTRAVIPTGLAFSIPRGFEGQVRPRSGLAARYGITLVNSPGTIDADYRGEVKILLINLGSERFVIKRGERIAQLVIAPVARVQIELVEELEDSARGENGFGSSGS